MYETAGENFSLAYELLKKSDDNKPEQLKENEKFLDKTETVLGEYILRITEKSLAEENSKLANEMMKTVTDWERISDHCYNISLHMRQRMSGEGKPDTHVKLKKEYEFKRLYHQYSKLYYEPVLKHNINEYKHKHKEQINTEQRE